MTNNLNIYLFVGWLVALCLVFCPPRTPPGASPALAQGASAGGQPVCYAHPAPLTYEQFPWPPLPDDCPPGGYCPVSRAAVTAQGVGE